MRGLMRLDTGQRPPRLHFTEAGLAALLRFSAPPARAIACAMMADRRFADPEKFAHVRRELGIDPAPETVASQE